eukprot:comp19745_c0_seq1/m.23563 comp19745_c0_seq1/g.23563  ORF comp19745_c0_seq1/g.23563 comp19745_c0_seq1/m.23563 type:complete len:125 (-) comp19745_c0_seq1:262-636(-)
MVMIPVQFDRHGTGLQEWGLVELQGELVTKGNYAGRPFGEFYFDEKGDPHIVVAYHHLVGKKQALDEPFAVMQKVHQPQNDTMEDGPTAVKEYQVVALIKHKYVFKNRPQAIIKDELKGKASLK